MAQATAKDLLKEAVEHLPENASIEEAVERLVFLSKIERGLTDAAAGRTVTHEEVKRRLRL